MIAIIFAKTKTKMSKEQTPITAEEFLDAKGFSMDDFPSIQRYLLIRDLMEQYAQARVLEALERVQNKATIYGVDVSWIETEVKPKYEEKNS